MAEQTLIQFRADKLLKEEVSAIYESLGMDLTTALRMFMVRSKLTKGLPFPAIIPEETITRKEALSAFDQLRAQASNVSEMTLEEINAEIADVRKARKVK